MIWLTKNITRYIRKRNTAFQADRKFGKPEHHSKYRKLRNKVVNLMRSAKSSYFQHLNPKNRSNLEGCKTPEQRAINHSNTQLSRFHC